MLLQFSSTFLGEVCLYTSKDIILLMFTISKYTKSFSRELLKSFVFLADQDYTGRKIYAANPYMKEIAWASYFQTLPASRGGRPKQCLSLVQAQYTHRPDISARPCFWQLTSSPRVNFIAYFLITWNRSSSSSPGVLWGPQLLKPGLVSLGFNIG